MGNKHRDIGKIRGHSNVLILARAQEHQCAGFLGGYALVLGQGCQFRVFGAGIEDDAFGGEGEDIVVVGSLFLWIQVQADGIELVNWLGLGLYFNVSDAAFGIAQGPYGMLMGNQFVDGHETVSFWMGRGADDKGIFSRHWR